MIKFLVGLALVCALAWLVFGVLIWVINLPFLIGVIAIWLVVGMFAGGETWMSATQIKLILIGIYASIGLLFAVYQHFWGYYNDKSFAYNLGQGVVWPAVMFPVVGQVIGGVIMIAVIGYIVMKSK